MPRTRVLFAALLALTLIGGLLDASLDVAAQEATPVVDLSVTPPAQPGGTLPGSPQIQLVKVAGGLADPVNVAAPNDGSGRLFVVERVGRIRIIDQDGTLLPEPFLDLTELVQNDYLEQGLLGLAFHPDYASNGRFFVHFTDYHTNGDNFVMEFPVSATTRTWPTGRAGDCSLAVDQPYVNHNGGTIHFGPDGYLYIAIGDGGLGGDPYDNAQDRTKLLGKMLRIDVDADGGLRLRHPGRQPVRQARIVQSNSITDVIGETEGLSLEAGVLPSGGTAGDLGLRPAQPLAVQLRPGDGRPLHRRRRAGHLGGDQLPARGQSRRPELRLGLPGVRSLLPGGGRPSARGRRSARSRWRSTSTGRTAARSPASASTAARSSRPSTASTSTPTGARAGSGGSRAATMAPGSTSNCSTRGCW